MFDRSAADICKRMHGVYEPEVNQCLIVQSRIPDDDPEFGHLKKCRYCGDHDAELTVVFLSRPANMDDVEVVCDKCIMKPYERRHRREESIWDSHKE